MAAMATAGCDRPAPPIWTAVVDTLPGGVVAVRNPAAGRWSVDRPWRTELDLRIGSLDGDGPDVFGHVAALEVDPLGRVYVLDAQAAEVRVFSADGGPVRVLGRRGGGPGELRGPVGLAWGPEGHLWVIDPGNGRYSIHDTTGAFVRAVPRATPGVIMPWPGGIDAHGRLLDVALARDPVLGVRTTLVRLTADLVGDPDTVRLPEFRPASYEGTRQAEGGGFGYFTAPIPFSPNQIWHFDPRGYLWHGITAPYRIVQGTLDGDTVRIIEREYTPDPVTAADRVAALERLKPLADAGIALDPGRIPAHKPAFDSFFTGDDGYLWVVPPQPPPRDDRPRGIAAVDVFDPGGQYLGRLELAATLSPGTLPIARDGALYGVELDDLDVPRVVRLRVLGR
jgi:hypothetical protein